MDDPAPRTSLSRAALLKLGAATAVIAGAGTAGRASAGKAPAEQAGTKATIHPVPGPTYLRFATYPPLVGSTFVLRGPGPDALIVELESVTPLPSDGESFSLRFRGSARPSVASRIYRIEHATLGRFELFLSPVGPGAKSLRLEAVINRIPI